MCLFVKYMLLLATTVRTALRPKAYRMLRVVWLVYGCCHYNITITMHMIVK